MFQFYFQPENLTCHEIPGCLRTLRGLLLPMTFMEYFVGVIPIYERTCTEQKENIANVCLAL